MIGLNKRMTGKFDMAFEMAMDFAALFVLLPTLHLRTFYIHA